jgi:hypothetical protein
MRYLIVIIGLIFVGCDKEELSDCRQCVILEKNLTTGIESVYDVTDCRNIIREENRTYVDGQYMMQKVVRCNPPK